MVENQIDKLELSISQADLASWLGVSCGRLNSTLILSKNEAANERIKTILVVDADKK